MNLTKQKGITVYKIGNAFLLIFGFPFKLKGSFVFTAL